MKKALQKITALKSHWYYWHTGNKITAVLSMIITSILVTGILIASVGFSIWGLILAVLMDAAGFMLAAIYLLIVRPYYPDLFYGQEEIDMLVVNFLLAPLIFSFFISRITTFYIAKKRGHLFALPYDHVNKNT
jgi:hypothetical protein|tara:strand:+ start:122 stop:520 length:399 start_codon:yes stop_codon:yes gene_type:complete